MHNEDYKIQIRRDKESVWNYRDPILLEGELGYNTTNNKIKIGNGINSWKNLPYINDSISNSNLGYALFINTLHTSSNPFEFESNTLFNFPIRSDFKINDQSTTIIDSLVDNDTNKITVNNLNDFYLIRLQFKMKTSLSDRKGEFYFDIGNGDKFNPKKFNGSSNANEIEDITEEIMFFQKETFLQNGGLIRTIINGSGEIHDIQLLVIKLHHGKNI